MPKPVASFSIAGDRQLRRGLASLPPVVQRKVIRPAVSQSATIVSKAMKQNAKRVSVTGALAKSIGKRVKSYKETVVASVGPRVGWRQGERVPSNYDHLVEKGAQPHVIRPRNAEALSASGIGAPASQELEGFRLEIGHPGASPKPFVRPAVESTRSAVLQKQAEVLRKKLPLETKRHIEKQRRKRLAAR